jgi:Fe2+ transport system protein FeoA
VSQNEAKRLADMGFVTGVRVEMVRIGEPCIVRLNGTLVGLGVAHQRVIRVVICA